MSDTPKELERQSMTTATWTARYNERESDPEILELPDFNFHSTHDLREVEWREL